MRGYSGISRDHAVTQGYKQGAVTTRRESHLEAALRKVTSGQGAQLARGGPHREVARRINTLTFLATLPLLSCWGSPKAVPNCSRESESQGQHGARIYREVEDVTLQNQTRTRCLCIPHPVSQPLIWWVLVQPDTVKLALPLWAPGSGSGRAG